MGPDHVAPDHWNFDFFTAVAALVDKPRLTAIRDKFDTTRLADHTLW
jgi:hypothetical protein